MEKKEAVCTILLAMIVPALITGALSTGVPGDLLSKVLAVLIVAVISGAIAAVLYFILVHRTSKAKR